MQYTAQCGMLCRLSQLHGLYTVFDVTNAHQQQLGEDDPDAKLLVTTTTGNPIKDMVTTRGKVFAGALPKETHCSCRNKRNNRGIILPPKKCVYAEYCSKKNIGSLPDAKNLRYHMEVICHCRYFSINQAFTCDLTLIQMLWHFIFHDDHMTISWFQFPSGVLPTNLNMPNLRYKTLGFSSLSAVPGSKYEYHVTIELPAPRRED